MKQKFCSILFSSVAITVSLSEYLLGLCFVGSIFLAKIFVTNQKNSHP